MAIADITAPTPLKPGPSCTVCRKLAELEDAESAALLQLLSDPAWRYSELSERLRDEGHDMPAEGLARHARGLCAARTRLR